MTVENSTPQIDQLVETFKPNPYTDHAFFEPRRIESMSLNEDLRGAGGLGFPASRTCANFCSPEYSEAFRPDGKFYGDPIDKVNQTICCYDHDGLMTAITVDGFSIVEEANMAEAGIFEAIEGPNETFPEDSESLASKD